jgi:hypothetical protein
VALELRVQFEPRLRSMLTMVGELQRGAVQEVEGTETTAVVLVAGAVSVS